MPSLVGSTSCEPAEPFDRHRPLSSSALYAALSNSRNGEFVQNFFGKAGMKCRCAKFYLWSSSPACCGGDWNAMSVEPGRRSADDVDVVGEGGALDLHARERLGERGVLIHGLGDAGAKQFH